MASDRAQILITAVDQTRTALDGIRNNLGRLGDETRRVQGLLAGLGVSLTLGAFAALVKGAIDSADELNKLSQKIGISVEALSTLQFAAQLSDVGLDTLKTGLKGLSANLTEARAGLGEGAAIFQALGISVEDTAGNLKSSDTILLEIADGDGVNDAPALAQADVGVAIGAGTDVAIETADLVLMRSDPLDVAIALRIGRGTLRKMRQNLGWAIGYNVIALPIAAWVFEPTFGLVLRPEIAALSMSGSSFLVAVNAIMLKRLHLPEAEARTTSTGGRQVPSPV